MSTRALCNVHAVNKSILPMRISTFTNRFSPVTAQVRRKSKIVGRFFRTFDGDKYKPLQPNEPNEANRIFLISTLAFGEVAMVAVTNAAKQVVGFSRRPLRFCLLPC